MQVETEQTVRSFIEENFLFRDDSRSLSADASLLDAGLIDSTGILELLGFLESRFGIAIEDAEIIPENLDSIRAIAQFVVRKCAGENGTAAPTASEIGQRCA